MSGTGSPVTLTSSIAVLCILVSNSLISVIILGAYGKFSSLTTPKNKLNDELTNLHYYNF